MNNRGTHDFIREMKYRIKCLEKMISIRDDLEREAVEEFKKSVIQKHGAEIQVYDLSVIHISQNWLERLFKRPKESVEFKKPTRELMYFVNELDLFIRGIADGMYSKEENCELSIKDNKWKEGNTFQLNQTTKTSDFLDQLIESFGVESITNNTLLPKDKAYFNGLIAIHKEVINKTSALGSNEWLLYTDDYKEIYTPIYELVHRLAVIPKR